MPNYSNTVIYKIICNDQEVTDVYVGHTVDFRKRKNNHKSNCNNEKKKEYNYLIYKTIRNNGGWSNWSMVEVEASPCENITEATLKERYWVEKLKATLNSNIPSRTYDQYHQDNKEEVIEYKKKWYQDNREKILKKAKEKINCDCGGCYTKSGELKHLKSKNHLNYLKSL